MIDSPSGLARLDEASSAETGVEALLGAVVAASRELLAVDFMSGLKGALRVLGEGTGVDRAYAVRYDHGMQAGFFVAEHCAPGIGSVTELVGSGPYSYADYEEVWRPLLAGRGYTSPLVEKTGANAELNQATGTKRDLFVPVFVAGVFWGALGFDDCRTGRTFSAAEVEVLRGAAAALAAALARREVEEARVAALENHNAELRAREGLLSTVTLAAKTLLAGGNFEAGVNATLELLGRALGVQRAGLVETLPASQGRAAGCWRLVHEWNDASVSRQMDGPDREGDCPGGDFLERQTSGLPTIMRIKPECGGFDEGQQRAGVVTILSVPIRVRERWWGSLSFDECRSERAWAGHEIATLETAAACIGAALERREIEDARLAAERVRGEGVEALNRLLGGMVTASRALLESADFAAGLRRWLECLALASEADRATLGRFLESERDGEISAENIDWAREGFASLSELPIPDGADVRTWIERLRRGELVWAQREELRDEATVRWWEAAACASCLIVPLVVEGRTMGWLSLDWGKRRERRADLAALLRTASDGAAAAIRRHEAVQALNAEREARAVELARLNRELDRRNRLLDASARASALLSASEDFDAAVREALGNGGRPSL